MTSLVLLVCIQVKSPQILYLFNTWYRAMNAAGPYNIRSTLHRSRRLQWHSSLKLLLSSILSDGLTSYQEDIAKPCEILSGN